MKAQGSDLDPYSSCWGAEWMAQEKAPGEAPHAPASGKGDELESQGTLLDSGGSESSLSALSTDAAAIPGSSHLPHREVMFSTRGRPGPPRRSCPALGRPRHQGGSDQQKFCSWRKTLFSLGQSWRRCFRSSGKDHS